MQVSNSTRVKWCGCSVNTDVLYLTSANNGQADYLLLKKDEIMYRGTMKHTLLIALGLCFATLSFAQTVEQEETTAKSDITIDQIFRKYNNYKGAVLNMTREEWDVFRAWEGYDREEHIAILQEKKAAYNAVRDQRAQQRMAQTGGCDCWIEPDDTYTQITSADWTASGGAGIDVDCYLGPIGFNGWSHNHYGQNFNAFYIGSKGVITFGEGHFDWTPEEFPGATYNQIAGYWADADYRTSGEIWYKVTDEAVYVNFIDVGYYNDHADKLNSYQIIITPEGSTILPEGNNVQLCYLDMQWAHGDTGGPTGCGGGTNPGTVGADQASPNGANIQYGRFGYCDFGYNGPYGDTPQDQDGVYWLNGKQFNFNTFAGQSNIPPISTASFGCDTVTLCLNDTLDLDFQFLAPETNQQVQIDYAVDGVEGNLTVDNIANGNIATFEGYYVGNSDNLGFNTITFTGTDNGSPEAATEISVVVEVIDVELPTLSVDGAFSICSGAETTLTASPGFDNYEWSSGCTTPECTFNVGGFFTLEASIEAGCSADLLFEIDQTPYFLPCIEVNPNPICSDETATVTVCEDEQDEYVSYAWEGDWNGLGGDVLSQDGPTAEITAGTFRLLVENTEGCFGQRVFNVNSIDPFIPEDTWSGAYCDGLEDVTFEGGYSNPAEGNLNIYLQSSDGDGWLGSFINVYINGELEGLYTSTSVFTIETISIEAGDEIEIEYISIGEGDENNDVLIYNCTPENEIDPDPGETGFENGEILFSGVAGCSAEPAYGEWTVTGPNGWSITDDTQFDMTFTPGDYGLYELCFIEASCAINYCYLLEYTEEPSVSLNETDIILCGNESFTFIADIVDIGGTATIDWPSPAADDQPTATYSFDEPVNLDLSVVVENGCGTASADFTISAQANPEFTLEDEFLCEGGTVPLDPIENDTPDLVYEWTLDGNVISTDPEIEADQTGVYCVTVSNDCTVQGTTDCADISIAGDFVPPFDDLTIDCDGDGSATLTAELPQGWSMEWPTGEVVTSYPAQQQYTSEQEICVEVTDPGECDTQTFCTQIVITTPPTSNPEPTEGTVLCPELPELFTVNSPEAFLYTWTIECNGEILQFEGGDNFNLVSSMLPTDCWYEVQNLQVVAENECGQVTETYEIFIDACEITVPNIFTPNGDGTNDTFEIGGLDVYDDVRVWIYNRWGTLVYKSNDYNSGDWTGVDEADGTYWYVIVLPNGGEYDGTVTVKR